MHYPILVFCYNRAESLKRLIYSIELNKNYKKHKYFFFCDGFKRKKFKNIIIKQNIKKIIKNFKVTKKIIFRKNNYGLAKNIILGVTEILKKNTAVIVLEDDLYLKKNFLEFINFSLNHFRNSFKIGSVTGYSYADKYKLLSKKDFFYSYRHCSWGWGTWRKVWNKINWKKTDNDIVFSIKNNIYPKNFLLSGSDFPILLKLNNIGLINSWAIKFNYFCSKNNLYSFCPRFSLLENLGYGLDSTHNKNFLKKKKIKFKKKIINYKKINKVKLEKKICNLIQYEHSKTFSLKIKYLFYLVLIKIIKIVKF